jgi:arsenate reductase-like glutaredoxin family protein
MVVQIFGTNKSKDTQKAVRFCKERRIEMQFVDLRKRDIAPAELARFVQKFGLDALIDTAGKAYKKAGLEYMRVPDEQMIDKLVADPGLMQQPLIRSGKTLTIGWNEALWRTWYEEEYQDH